MSECVPVVHFYEEVTSTNEVARSLAEGGAPHGTLVVAKRQSAGRGRLGRVWSDGGAGNCIASLILRPTLPIGATPLICLAAGVAIQRECGSEVGLKWPNDLVDRSMRKVGGILAEMETDGPRVAFVIVGFGVNLISVPVEAPNPVSLSQLGVKCDAESFAVRCATNLLRWVSVLPNQKKTLLTRWQTLDFTLDKAVRIGEVYGVAKGVDSDGTLLVLTDSGELRGIRAGDVEMVTEF